MWIYGKHAVLAAVSNPNRHIIRLVVSQKGLLDEFSGIKRDVRPELVEKDYLSQLFSKDAIHQSCAVLVKHFDEVTIEDLIEDEKDLRPFVFLDQITDPQNVGSILRASAVFGARAVVITEHNSPDLTSVIAKAASGAMELVPVIKIVNLVTCINELKKCGFWCVGLDERADQSIYDANLSGKHIIVIGSEGEGMRRLTREACDFLTKLPSAGDFSTLNAAQAATVCLYEILRQSNNARR